MEVNFHRPTVLHQIVYSCGGNVTKLWFSCLRLVSHDGETGVGGEKSRLIQNGSIPGRWGTVVTKITFPLPGMIKDFYEYVKRGKTKERGS